MDGSENFELTYGVNIDTNLGIEIIKHRDGTCELKKTCLSKMIVEKLNSAQIESHKGTTPVSSPLLHIDLSRKR